MMMIQRTVCAQSATRANSASSNAIRIIELIQEGRGEKRHVTLLRNIARNMKDGSMCKKGKDHADMLSEFLTTYSEDFCRHVRGICDDQECPSLVQYMINGDRCTMCDVCRVACPSTAIEGQKREPYKTGFMPFRVRQKRCTHCGLCLAVCPEGAVYVPADVTAPDKVRTNGGSKKRNRKIRNALRFEHKSSRSGGSYE